MCCYRFDTRGCHAIAARRRSRETTAYCAAPVVERAPTRATQTGQVRKRVFLRHFTILIKVIILPRQARDKHRESTQQKRRVFGTGYTYWHRDESQPDQWPLPKARDIKSFVYLSDVTEVRQRRHTGSLLLSFLIAFSVPSRACLGKPSLFISARL